MSISDSDTHPHISSLSVWVSRHCHNHNACIYRPNDSAYNYIIIYKVYHLHTIQILLVLLLAVESEPGANSIKMSMAVTYIYLYV